ncbi:MAG: DUF3179 domain-containing protein [Acidobacteria bacterium]|nr:DUF3179 domain-containing protein [Acidobacteriota bacterium]
MKQALFALLLAAVAAGCGSGGSSSVSANRDSPLSAGELQELSAGWKTDFARHTVPLREFQSGGPGKDGIPALDRPHFVRTAEASFLRPRAGTRLRTLPARIVAWRSFRAEHPDGFVLSRNTGYSRPYGENPYLGYDDVSSPPLFPTRNADDKRLPPKERVVFLERDGSALAIPFSTLAKKRQVEVTLAGHRFDVRWQGDVSSALDSSEIASGRDVGAAQVLERGRPATFSEPFWFAIAAFRPHVQIVR